MSESLPTTRHRLGLSGLIAHRFTDVTLRLSERLYVDSWGLKATTTDFLLPWDISKHVELGPHLRLHAQTGVDFWQLAYTARPRNGKPLELPILRTGDRENGPLVTGTGGLGLRFILGEHTPTLSLTGDAMYTRFLDHLYTQSRWAGYASMLFEVEIQ